MKINSVLGVALLAFSVLNFSAQTKGEFKQAFGIGSDLVYRGVNLEPKFDKNGQICRLQLRLPNSKADKISAHYATISGATTEEILNLIVSEDQRGKRTDDWGISWFLGQVYLTPHNFENLTVTIAGHIWPKTRRVARKDGEDVGASDWRVLTPDGDSIFPRAEQATFVWKRRPCH